jgi:hypothetical protein
VELCEVFNQRGEVVLACEHLLMISRKNQEGASALAKSDPPMLSKNDPAVLS